MKLAATHRPLGSFERPLLALGVTIIFALASNSRVALGMGHGGGGSGGGNAGGCGSGGGHAAGSGGGGHVGGGHVGSFAGHVGGGHPGGGQFGAEHFGHFPQGHRPVFFHHHGHGFHGLFASGAPFGVPYDDEYPAYSYNDDPYCDPSSPWYDPAYCHWRHRDN